MIGTMQCAHEPGAEVAVWGHHACWPVPPDRPLAMHLEDGDKLLF